MAEKFITGEHDGHKFSAFITSNKPACPKGGEHEWNGEALYTFHNDDRILKESEIKSMPTEEQEKLNTASCEVSCSKCGMGAMTYDNPYYSEI